MSTCDVNGYIIKTCGNIHTTRPIPQIFPAGLTSYWPHLGFSNTSISLVLRIGYLTDHNSVRITLKTSTQPRGRGFWKLNTSILNDKEYETDIKQVIKTTAEDNANANPSLLWDTIKLQCRGASIKHCSRKKKEKCNRIKELDNLICCLQNTANIGGDPDAQAKLSKAKADLDKEVEEVTKGNIIRCRARWCEVK